MNIFKLKKKFIVYLAVLIATPLNAANVDAIPVVGETGVANTSIGEFDISISKGDGVSITGITGSGGITVSGDNAGANKTGSMSVCTFVSTSNYKIDINSLDTDTDKFDASNGLPGRQAKAIPFEVLWDDGNHRWTFSNNRDRAKVGDTTGISRTDPSCAGGTNTTITVSIRNRDFNKVPGGHYSDTLAIIIAAQ